MFTETHFPKKNFKPKINQQLYNIDSLVPYKFFISSFLQKPLPDLKPYTFPKDCSLTCLLVGLTKPSLLVLTSVRY